MKMDEKEQRSARAFCITKSWTWAEMKGEGILGAPTMMTFFGAAMGGVLMTSIDRAETLIIEYTLVQACRLGLQKTLAWN